jgi:hypothetical protein
MICCVLGEGMYSGIFFGMTIVLPIFYYLNDNSMYKTCVKILTKEFVP